MKPGEAPESGDLRIFVYFRSPPAAREAVVDALARHFGAVGNRCGARGHASVREDRDKPYLTFLETWDGVLPTALDSLLEAIDESAIASGLTALAVEGRHREVFRAIAVR